MYVAHESDDVTITRWAMYAVVLSVIWGPALIGIAGGLGFASRPSKLGLILGGLGGLVAAAFYFGGLWVFIFRYPPHWVLYVEQLLGALGASVALGATAVQARALGRAKVP
jgi:hypothetical protein